MFISRDCEAPRGERRGLSFQFVAGVAGAGQAQAGAALIRASLEIRDTVRWSHSNIPQKPLTFINAVEQINL